MRASQLVVLALLTAGLSVGSTTAGCVGDDPGVSPNGTDGGGGSEGSVEAGPVGGACKANSECPSGFCADGVCCASACAGQCESCIEPGKTGQCVAVSGVPRNGRRACAGAGDATCGGSCDGKITTSCTYPATECRAGSCSNGVATSAATCVDGGCPVAATTLCDNTTKTKYCGAKECVGVAQVVAGYDSTCAVMSDQTVRCWGTNSAGQLGSGQSDSVDHTVPVVVSGLTGVTKLTFSPADGGHLCALLADQTAKCWGPGGHGALGNGVADPAFAVHAPSLVQKTAGATFTGLKDITAGDGFTCALDTTGAAWCWGSQLDGRLGDGTVTSTDRLFPVAVTNGGPGRGAIAAGVDHTCVSQSGAGATGALCWGFNSNYAVGQSGGGDVPTATAVTGGAFLNGAALTPVAAGNSISCGITTSSTLSCWGSNSFGRLGRNVDQATLPSTETPAPVCRQGPCASADLLTGVKSVAIGEQHACAVASGNVAGSKVVRCWGTEVAGRGTLGDDNGAHVTLTAASEPSLPTSADQVAAGAYHTCALLVDRTVRCWGTNNSGKLGNGLNANTPVPALVKF